MIRPLTRTQKLIAYTSLVLILGCTALGLFAIWVILSER